MGHNHSKEERCKKIISSNNRARTGTVQKIFEKVFRRSKADAEILTTDASATIFPCSPIIATTADTNNNNGPSTQSLVERQSTCNKFSSISNVALNISPKQLSFDYLQSGRLQIFDEYGRERMDENNNILLSSPKCSSSMDCNATQSSTLLMHSCYTNGNYDPALRNVIQRNTSSSVSFTSTPKFWGKAMYQGNNMAVYNVQTSHKPGASKSTMGRGLINKNNPPNKGKVHSQQGSKKIEHSKKEIKKTAEKSGNIMKSGCCKPVAPPVFIEAFNRSSGENNFGRGNSCNPADKLKNVDVVEELLYYVPAPDICKDCDDNEFDYYCINECGDMELVQCPPKESPKSCSFNPVKYSRRQRFNFKDIQDEPPFPWLGPQIKSCCCQCCKAGLRRNLNCCCACCAAKGVARVSNSFDEIPVGKNPQILAKNFDAPCTPKSGCESTSSSEESSDNCQEMLPKESGLYFYDANRQRFVRQEPPLTPEPVCVTNVEPPPPPPPPPPKKKPTIQPVIQPVVMQPPCPPPPCPPKPCCCENSCNCKCKETPPPTFVPVMMCGGYNGGNNRCRPRYCGPPCCMPPPCGPPCCPNPYQYPPPGHPQNYPQHSQSKHSSNTGEKTEEHSTDSDETANTGSGSMDEDPTITASVTRQANSTITSITVPPGTTGDVQITS